jgi:hypothetical protein
VAAIHLLAAAQACDIRADIKAHVRSWPGRFGDIRQVSGTRLIEEPALRRRY